MRYERMLAHVLHQIYPVVETIPPAPGEEWKGVQSRVVELEEHTQHLIAESPELYTALRKIFFAGVNAEQQIRTEIAERVLQVSRAAGQSAGRDAGAIAIFRARKEAEKCSSSPIPVEEDEARRIIE